MSKKALGKGIGALLKDEVQRLEKTGDVQSLPLRLIKPSPLQPRKSFSEESLAELAASIREQGVLQPIIVEQDQEAGGGEAAADGTDGTTGAPDAEPSYTVIAGERRFRAARMAGLTSIPVLIRRLSPEDKLEIALIENIQREDLTPVEEAQSYRQLAEAANLSQEEIARKVGKKRSTVANALRLLKLPEDMLDALDRAEMTAGHARAILSVVNPSAQTLLFGRILKEGLSVRQAELEAERLNQGRRPSGGQKSSAARKRNPELEDLEQRLIERMGTKVVLRGTMGRGRIEISYFSQDDLERLLDLLEG